ncbi:MAG: response regulator transcription factor [Eubacterium sp.]|nr:response regulator transcription factor [Eubacterium sp.]
MVDILIVEDNAELAQLLCSFLLAEHYTACIAKSGEEALRMHGQCPAKLVVLDIMLPGMDGFAVCKSIREVSDTPILIISAKNQKEDQLNGLMLGADDYIEKPYDIDILLAKISNIFKRRYAQDALVDNGVRLDKIRRTVSKDGAVLELTAKEFELLRLLMENKGKVLRKEYLFDRIWGIDSFSEPQTLTVHIKWLRQKIEDDPKHPKRIVTVWGVGYQYL